MTAVPATASARVRIGRIAIGLLAVCATLTTSACAAGRHASTAKESPAVDANAATIGRMELRGVAIAAPSGVSYASGSTAELLFVVVNTGQQPDTLTSVTTQSAGGVSVAQASGSASASGSESATTSPTGSASGSASASASGSASAAAFTPVEIPAGERRSFGVGDTVDYHLTLSGLTQQLFGGSSIRVTFTFAKAGSATITVPVQLTVNTSGVVVTAGETAGATPANG